MLRYIKSNEILRCSDLLICGVYNTSKAAEMRFLRHVPGYTPVSYTHLDVYKRQHKHKSLMTK